MRYTILTFALGCAAFATALPINNTDPLANVKIAGTLVPVNATSPLIPANTTDPSVPTNLTSPLPDVGEDPLSGAAFLASPPASSDLPTSDPLASDDPFASNPPTSNSTTGIPPASNSLANSSPTSSPPVINPPVINGPVNSGLPFKFSPTPEASAFSPWYPAEGRSTMHSAILIFILGVAASTFALPLNTTDSQVPATITGLPEGISAYAYSGTAFAASSETSMGPADIESPSSLDPPSSDPPASNDPPPSNDPPASSNPPLSPSPPEKLSGGAALSQ
ncbi:hypothetical protein EWM64_g5709 [Hericium alpestre]|uniref:Uncharacterized protein n=1 Tax=Hericium alpestre TaxID=135208 RepID=A0A4Y9ZVT4_9AGAM|nr:hypothetical protein EWM64_g5709 [Hericium alpestre]